MTASRRAVILRDFNDAGTGENFTANDTVTLPAGRFAEYEHGGLVAAAPAAKREPATRTTAPKSPRAPRAKRPAKPSADRSVPAADAQPDA